MKNSLICIESIRVSKLEKPTRLQDLAAGLFIKKPSKSGIKKAVKKGLIFINNKKAKLGDFLYGNEYIQLYQERVDSKNVSIDIPLEVLYEDAYLAVVNKPAGITVSGNKKWTLENALSSHLKKSNIVDALPQPKPIHRLDHPTSGALLIGKTSTAVITLNQYFKQKSIEKIYYAVTIKKMLTSGTVQLAIDGKASHSDFQRIDTIDSDKFEALNLVEISPKTGRRHQIRIHLASLGNAILGDKEHGIDGYQHKGKGMYLHAYSLQFIHPISGEICHIKAKLPKKFKRLFPKACLNT
ncbi:MAG: RluA family pseudouridine synthase [Flavicella sp.]